MIFLFVAALGLSACKNEEVTVHLVPKGAETITPEKPGTDVVGLQPEREHRIWELPPDWVEAESNIPMRFATILVPQEGSDPVEVAISVFPGDVGGELANVNRWRTQMGLAGIQEAPLKDQLRRFSTSDFTGYYLRINAADGALLAGGNYNQKEDRTWFVRSETLSSSVADELEQALFDFLQTFGREGK